ncbi:MAG: DUF4914 family protein, partial [bacterium]
MNKLFDVLKEKQIELPGNVRNLLEECKSFTVFDTTRELAEASTGGKENSLFEVKYDIAGKEEYVEAIVHQVTNGISVNYTEPYMRRRDPSTMVIADDLPTDKVRFKDKYGYDFSSLRYETFEWLKKQDLALFFYFAGREGIGGYGFAIAPTNAAFFAMGLSMLQAITPVNELPGKMKIETGIYVAPPFRHTHFGGKQVVVHDRSDSIHEMYSYNLYPGPSAKKGLYGFFLTKGEREGWITAHCSAVKSISPYDNITNFMHE